ncbi:prepilin-type N-terminal cleavage/methylation domain-containing protein [Sulfurimonas sp. HSL-3221]|uniref:prepilin-type N-terminal cleavage/methylation domain-containing protein n=1 Tax=Sulfurimonadaceae TaxID=2771471 RepID=UPI001E608D23|nr:prepilin-type N-terminal cleavage/methylation domain-containing protein [Sulfurimonas sp. HSL-3221]UFS62091.1 prepilin-type N-terminal cleavage/methylation domain-containing protein [Sulfurimonas sp. HSL-3221]
MKRAFTMIEMIFAIIIIGITVAGVSQIMTRSGNTMEGALSQEAVFLASMEAAKIFSHRWDPNSKDTSSELAYSKILDTNWDANHKRTCLDTATGSKYAVPCAADDIQTVLRYGGIAEDKHRRFHSQSTASSQPYPDGVPNGTTDINITNEHGYKRTYQVAVNSGYIGTAFATGTVGGPTDIKMTVVSINDKNNGNANLVRMRVYSYNIGEIDYAKRTFQ